MDPSQTTTARQCCENLLSKGKRYNLEHHILSSENAITDRLLSRGLELKEAYAELHGKLHAHHRALPAFLDMLLSTAAFWSPEDITKARTGRDDLANVNRQIARKANELADLLACRSDLHDTSGFCSSTHYHVCDVIEAASEGNGLFNSYLKAPLKVLAGQFDLKYWPSLSQLLQAIASDARQADTEANDPLTEAATTATRSSRADFFKAWFAAIDENREKHHGPLPDDFQLTDQTLASLTNAVLDIGLDDLMDGTYVKRFRQREREGMK